MADLRMDAMWDEAVKRYERTTKKKIKDLPRPRTASELIQEVQDANNQYESFRNKSAILFKILSAVATPIELVGDLAAGAASAAFPPSTMIFGAAKYLIQAARGVSAILDAIADLMKELQNFSVRLKVYDRGDLSTELREKLTEILVTMVEILASSTKKVTDPAFRAKAYLKNVILGNDEVLQGLLSKLDRLTRSENFLTGAETYVEMQSTGKGVQALQTSMNAMQLSANATSQGIADIKAVLNKSKAQSYDEDRHNPLEALKRILNPSATAQEKFDQIRRERRLVPHSGDWILHEEVFSRWVERTDWPLLWITGTPGSGKSFLTYNIVTGLHELSNAKPTSASYEASVGFFLFQDNNIQTQSFKQALCDVAYQLAQNDPVYSKYLNAAGLSAGDLSSVGLVWKTLFADYWLSDRASGSAVMVLDGLDEALPQDRETFFDLLKDVEDLGTASKLRMAMLGRPHIVEEMSLAGLKEPPTIYLDSTKNGADIAAYVRSSVAKSQALKRVSAKLKAKIIETLTMKAGGMFMWVKLMIAELNRKAQRSRESEVEKVLNEAPRGLTEMIHHVFEGFSVSLSLDEADDLNTMLMCVALARRPLCLGELDAALRLNSEEGIGLVFLEGMLRKTYASLFTLSREDGLNTSELLTSERSAGYDEFDDSNSYAITRDGEEDLDFPVEFSSSPATTIVSFSHASILDYLLNPNHGKVTAAGDRASAVGVDIEAAHAAISKSCIDIITNEAYRQRMQGSVDLLNYAISNWHEHLEHAKRELMAEEARSSMGVALVQMLRDEDYLYSWTGSRNASFFSNRAADCLIPWLKDPLILSQVDSHFAEWLNSLDVNQSIEVFRPSMQYVAKQWLGISDSISNTAACPVVIHCWLARSKGETIDSIPRVLAVDEIMAAAQFGGFEENAGFNRRLAMSLRDHGHYEEAKKQFGKALELDPDLWTARAGIALVHQQQEQYQQAIDLSEAVIDAIEAHPKETLNSTRMYANAVYQRIAKCYQQLENQVVEHPSETLLELQTKACQYYHKAFEKDPADTTSFSSCVEYWQIWANYSLPRKPPFKYGNPDDVPAPDRCYKQIMGLVHELHDLQTDELSHWLWSTTEHDAAFESTIACAASKTGELQWLQDRYSEAISHAGRALKPVTAAAMVLSLATLCDRYIDDGDKALRLYESLASERALTTREQTEIMWTRKEALSRLSLFCVRKAMENESESERYIGKLETIWERSRRGAAAISDDTVPPSLFSIYLGVWYSKVGRHQDAIEVVRTHVKEAFDLLGDDDPTNDMDGYLNLGLALLAIRDDKNMTALMHSLRQFRSEVEMVSSKSNDERCQDSRPSPAKSSDSVYVPDNDQPHEDENHNNNQDGETPSDDRVACDGPCDKQPTSFENTFTCRYDFLTFCPSCHAWLLSDSLLPGYKCAGSHEFLEIPPLKTPLQPGEMLVDGVVMSRDAWKRSIKKIWNL